MKTEALSDIQSLLKSDFETVAGFRNCGFSAITGINRSRQKSIQMLLAEDYSGQSIRMGKKTSAVVKSAEPGIEQTIRRLATTVRPTTASAVTEAPYGFPTDLPGIHQLLHQQKNTAYITFVQKPVPSSVQRSDAINQLLKQRAANDRLDIGRASVASGEVVSTHDSPVTTSGQLPGWFRRIGVPAAVAVLVILLAAFAFQHLTAPKLRQVESPVAQFALDMAFALERYREENGLLPAQLSQLPEFPGNAIEWRIDQYPVKLAEPRQEFFYLDLPAGFIVISRKGNEAWSYTEEDNSLRQVPAH